MRIQSCYNSYVMLKNDKMKKIVIIVTAVFIVGSLLFMFGGNLFNGGSGGKSRKGDSTVMPEATEITSEIKGSTIVEQSFVNTTDTISKVGIVFSRYSYLEGVHITMELRDGNTILATTSVNVANIEDQHRTYIEPASVLTGMKNKTLTIRIYSAEKEDTGMKIMMARTNDGSSFKFGKITVDGTLCFSVTE